MISSFVQLPSKRYRDKLDSTGEEFIRFASTARAACTS